MAVEASCQQFFRPLSVHHSSLQYLTLSHHIMLCFVYMLKCVHACILCIVCLSYNCLLNVCDKCQSTYDSPLNFDLTWCIIQPVPDCEWHQDNRQKWHHFSQVFQSSQVSESSGLMFAASNVQTAVMSQGVIPSVSCTLTSKP